MARRSNLRLQGGRREGAERALERICARPYKDAAVLFRDLETVEDTKEVTQLRERIVRIVEDKQTFVTEHSSSAESAS